MDLIRQFFEIFILGVIGASVPGPILTAVFTEVVGGGFVKSIKTVFRALISEIIVAGLILLVVFSISIPDSYFYVVSLLGAAFLIYIASCIWKIDKMDGNNGEIFGFRKIFLLTVLNGAFWIFWLTVCVPRAFVIEEQISGGRFMFLLFFESGWLTMTSFLAFAFSKFRSFFFRKNLVSLVFKSFALILSFFALKSIYQSIIYFF